MKNKIINKMQFIDKKKYEKNFLSKGKKLSKALSYIARENARLKNNTAFKTLGNQLSYIARENANLSDVYYFNKDGEVIDQDIFEKDMKDLDLFGEKKNMALYRHIISFDKKLEKELLSRYSQKELFEKMKPILEEHLLIQGFNLENILYTGQFHTNTQHLHFHFDFREIEPSRTKNKLNLEKNEIFLKKLNFELASDELKEILKKKDNVKKEFILSTRDPIKLNNLILDNISDPRIESSIEQLRKKNYSFLNKSTPEINAVVNRIANIYEKSWKQEFEHTLKEFSEIYEEVHDSEINILDSEKDKLDKNIQNIIFKELKNIAKETKEKDKKENKSYVFNPINSNRKKKFKGSMSMKKYLAAKKRNDQLNHYLTKKAGIKNLFGTDIFEATNIWKK